MKKVTLGAGLLLAALLATSCQFSFSVGGGDTAKLEDLMADLICTTSTSVQEMKNTNVNAMSPEELAAVPADMEKKAADMKATIDAMPKKHGFADDAAVNEAVKKITDKAAFTAAVTTKANAKCTPDADVLNGVLTNLK